MQTTLSGRPITTISTRVTEPPLELFITEKAFRPNPTTVRFARTVPVGEGDIVFDMGTGIGPLAIKAALDGAGQVYGVDSVPMHCELARLNVAKYGLQATCPGRYEWRQPEINVDSFHEKTPVTSSLPRVDGRSRSTSAMTNAPRSSAGN